MIVPPEISLSSVFVETKQGVVKSIEYESKQKERYSSDLIDKEVTLLSNKKIYEAMI